MRMMRCSACSSRCKFSRDPKGTARRLGGNESRVMSDANVPPSNSPIRPADGTNSEGQQQKATCFGITVILLGGAIIGAVAGICLLGGLDIWSEKQHPDLRESIRSLRPYFA